MERVGCRLYAKGNGPGPLQLSKALALDNVLPEKVPQA